MGKAIRSFIDAIGRWQIVQSLVVFIKPFVWPWILALLTAGAGYWGHQPLMWVLMASALAFMGTIVGIFFAGTYRDRITPANKILYLGTQVNYDLVALTRHGRRAQTTGAIPARTLSKTQIGVVLQNSAGFPIEAHMESAETMMEGLAPPRSMFPKQPVVILPGNSMMFLDDPIDMDGHVCEKLEGHMKISVKYGLPGRRKFELHFNGRVEALMRPEGFIQGTYTHWDSELTSLPTRN
jgi:hypothetical protein